MGLSVVSFKQYSDLQKTLNKEEKVPIPAEYMSIINNYPDILKVNFTTVPKHNVIHEIPTGNNKPCRAKVRPLMPNTPKYVQGKKAWQELEKLGIIEKVKPDELNEWSSALHLVTKSDGSLRPCGDYRALNAKTEDDSFPLPQIRHFSAELRAASHFSTLDLYRAYYNIEFFPGKNMCF